MLGKEALEILVELLILVISTVVPYWYLYGRSQFLPAVERRRLRFHYSTFVLGLTGILLASTLLFASRNGAPWSVVGLTSVTFVTSIWLILRFFTARHHFDGTGIVVRSLWGSRRHMKWQDVTELRHLPIAMVLRLRTSDGRTLRLPISLMNIAELCKVLQKRIPAPFIDEKTRQVLRRTIKLQPPDWLQY